jgi:hypothetical protein
MNDDDRISYFEARLLIFQVATYWNSVINMEVRYESSFLSRSFYSSCFLLHLKLKMISGRYRNERDSIKCNEFASSVT